MDIGVPKEKLRDLGVSIERLDLRSHINPDAMSDNRQINVWYNDRLVAAIFEIRTERNTVQSQVVYFGLKFESSIAADSSLD